MRFAASLLAALLSLAATAWAQDQAFTNRATELKDKGDANARTLTSLPENTAVKVLSRAGAWTQVDANGQKGWLRAFHIRFPVTIEKSSASSNPLASITSVFGGGRAEQRTTTATTGVRGLTPEDLKGASPNPDALAKAQTYRADKPAAERFAREGRLNTVQVDYREGGGR